MKTHQKNRIPYSRSKYLLGTPDNVQSSKVLERKVRYLLQLSAFQACRRTLELHAVPVLQCATTCMYVYELHAVLIRRVVFTQELLRR